MSNHSYVSSQHHRTEAGEPWQTRVQNRKTRRDDVNTRDRRQTRRCEGSSGDVRKHGHACALTLPNRRRICFCPTLNRTVETTPARRFTAAVVEKGARGPVGDTGVNDDDNWRRRLCARQRRPTTGHRGAGPRAVLVVVRRHRTQAEPCGTGSEHVIRGVSSCERAAARAVCVRMACDKVIDCRVPPRRAKRRESHTENRVCVCVCTRN